MTISFEPSTIRADQLFSLGRSVFAAPAASLFCANSQALVNLRKKERPPVLRTPNGPKKKVDPPLL
nr:MAG TPA: hypothetical protein [Caudoviricetes sp.]